MRIFLLSITEKTLAYIILNRLMRSISWNIIPIIQFPTKKGHYGHYVLYTTAREKISRTVDLYMVSRGGLWEDRYRTGYPVKIVSIICSFQDRLMAQVCRNAGKFEQLLVSNGTKQGRVIAALLFTMTALRYFDLLLDRIPVQPSMP